MGRNAQLMIGSHIFFESEEHEVMGLAGQALRLRNEAGAILLISLAEVMSKPDFEVLDARREEGDWPDGTLLALVDEKTKADIDARTKQLLEVRDGSQVPIEDEDDQDPSEPDDTTRTERVTAKGRDWDVSVRTVWRHLAKLGGGGPERLVDGRKFRVGKPEYPLFASMLRGEIDGLDDNASVSASTLFDRVGAQLLEMGLEEEIPSRATAYRIFERIADKSEIRGRAKYRSGALNRPKNANQPLITDHPGQNVLIDSTTTNVMVVDPGSGVPTRAVLLAAMDHYSRSVLGIRVAPTGKGVDVAMLLIEMMQPKPAGPLMGEKSRWRVQGVSEQWIMRLFPHCEESGVAGIPYVLPEGISLDRGGDYLSRTTQHGAKVMGSNLIYARPRTWIDKSPLERFFRAISSMLFERLPGFTGRDVTERGASPEHEAILYPAELEDIIYAWVAEVYQRIRQKGLHPPRAPWQAMSPNEMYEEGIARVGFINVPIDGGVRLELLPIKYRTIQSHGVRINNLTYDAPSLDPYRKPKPNHLGRKKWAFRVDPRDITKVHFKNPDTGAWHVIPWVHWPDSDIPFPEATMLFVRRRLIDSGKGKAEHLIPIEFAMMLDRHLSGVKVERAEAHAFRVFSVNALRAKKDESRLLADGPGSQHSGALRGVSGDLERLDAVYEDGEEVSDSGDDEPLAPLGSFGDPGDDE